MTLVLKNVNKHFSNAEEPTLNDVNLEIQRGEFVCIVEKAAAEKYAAEFDRRA